MELWLKLQSYWLTKIVKFHTKKKSHSKKPRLIFKTVEKNTGNNVLNVINKKNLLFAPNARVFIINFKICSYTMNVKFANIRFVANALSKLNLPFKLNLL